MMIESKESVLLERPHKDVDVMNDSFFEHLYKIKYPCMKSRIENNLQNMPTYDDDDVYYQGIQ